MLKFIFCFFPFFLLADRDSFPSIPRTEHANSSPSLLIMKAKVEHEDAKTNGYKVYDDDGNLVAYIDDYDDVENAVIINNIESEDSLNPSDIEINTETFIDEINF